MQVVKVLGDSGSLMIASWPPSTMDDKALMLRMASLCLSVIVCRWRGEEGVGRLGRYRVMAIAQSIAEGVE